MKILYYKKLYIFILLPFLSFASTDPEKSCIRGKYSKEKSINKEFQVNADAILKVQNDFGNLDITTWDENRIVMDIKIKVSGDDEEKVNNKLDDIHITFESSAKMVSAITNFNQTQKSWWDRLKGNWNGNNVHMEINYKIKMPITNTVDLNNDYGSITLEKITGNSKIHCDYGQILIDELLGSNNDINIDYTKNSKIRFIKNGNINADYSDLTIENAEQIKLNADYSKTKIIQVKQLRYNCDYGSLFVENAGSIEANGDYLNTDFGSISNRLNLHSDYGSIKIINLEPTVQNVTIVSDYTGVRIGYAPTLNFDYHISTSYGGVSLDDSMETLKKVQENQNKEYLGYHGNKENTSSVKITTSYGGVKILKNN